MTISRRPCLSSVHGVMVWLNLQNFSSVKLPTINLYSHQMGSQSDLSKSNRLFNSSLILGSDPVQFRSKLPGKVLQRTIALRKNLIVVCCSSSLLIHRLVELCICIVYNCKLLCKCLSHIPMAVGKFPSQFLMLEKKSFSKSTFSSFFVSFGVLCLFFESRKG